MPCSPFSAIKVKSAHPAGAIGGNDGVSEIQSTTEIFLIVATNLKKLVFCKFFAENCLKKCLMQK